MAHDDHRNTSTPSPSKNRTLIRSRHRSQKNATNPSSDEAMDRRQSAPSPSSRTAEDQPTLASPVERGPYGPRTSRMLARPSIHSREINRDRAACRRHIYRWNNVYIVHYRRRQQSRYDPPSYPANFFDLPKTLPPQQKLRKTLQNTPCKKPTSSLHPAYNPHKAHPPTVEAGPPTAYHKHRNKPLIPPHTYPV